jgi:hypothetical protein
VAELAYGLALLIFAVDDERAVRREWGHVRHISAGNGEVRHTHFTVSSASGSAA